MKLCCMFFKDNKTKEMKWREHVYILVRIHSHACVNHCKTFAPNEFHDKLLMLIRPITGDQMLLKSLTDLV